MQRCSEERDRLAQQNITLLAVKANLKGDLLHYVEVKHDVEGLKRFAAELQKTLALKLHEVDSLKREKEVMIHEIKDLQDEIEARKHEVK